MPRMRYVRNQLFRSPILIYNLTELHWLSRPVMSRQPGKEQETRATSLKYKRRPMSSHVWLTKPSAPGMLILVLVLVLKDSLRTFFKSLSLSWSLGVRSLSLSLSLGVRSRRSLSLSWSLGVRSLSLSWSLGVRSLSLSLFWSLAVRSLSLSWSLGVRSLSLSWSLGVRSLSLSWSLGVRSLLTSL